MQQKPVSSSQAKVPLEVQEVLELIPGVAPATSPRRRQYLPSIRVVPAIRLRVPRHGRPHCLDALCAGTPVPAFRAADASDTR